MSIPDRAATPKWDRGQRRQVIVQSVLTEIFRGELRAGRHLVTQELAERFGVSHTPIREALVALEGIGIVDLLPNRGAVIRRIGPEQVREVCQVRRVLECEATRGACGRIAPADLRALARDLRALVARSKAPSPGFAEEAAAVDSRLHDLIAASCRNAFLANELGRLKVLFRAFRDVAYARTESRFASGRFEAEAREHLAIVEALLAEDRRGAVRAMSRHIRMSVENWSGTSGPADPVAVGGDGEPPAPRARRHRSR